MALEGSRYLLLDDNTYSFSDETAKRIDNMECNSFPAEAL